MLYKTTKFLLEQKKKQVDVSLQWTRLTHSCLTQWKACYVWQINTTYYIALKTKIFEKTKWACNKMYTQKQVVGSTL